MRVAKNDSEAEKTVVANLSSAVSYVGGFGLLGFIFLMVVLVKKGIHPTALTFISLFYLSALFGICFLILQQIKNLSGKSQTKKREFQQDFQNEQLNPATTAQLEEPREPFISVTDSTTKTLDEVFIKRG